MKKLKELLSDNLGEVAINILAALAVLIGGWLLAFLLATIVRKILEAAKLDDRISYMVGRPAKKTNTTMFIAKVVYYVILIFTLIAFLKVLGLTIITEPLTLVLNRTFAFLPHLVAALILLFLAWVTASALRFIIEKVLSATDFDQSIAKRSGLSTEKAIPFSETIANVVYWLVYLLFLPTILNALKLEGVLKPVTSMLEKLLGFIPNLFGAAIIFIFGWLLAKIVRQILESLLLSIGTDKLAEKVDLDRFMAKKGLSNLLATIVYALILIPVIIAGLNALNIKSISDPATNMLSLILNALPSIFAATIVLAVTYIVARLVASLTTSVLTGMGFNNIFVKLGIKETAYKEDDKNTPSKIMGTLVIVALMLFAVIESARLLEFDALANLITRFLYFAGNIALGLTIFAIGLYLANVAFRMVSSASSGQPQLFAQITRIAIIALAAAMGIGEMGIAQNIVNLSFALIIGAVALAFALAFGLGAREVAAKEAEALVKKLKAKKE